MSENRSVLQQIWTLLIYLLNKIVQQAVEDGSANSLRFFAAHLTAALLRPRLFRSLRPWHSGGSPLNLF
jgi:hypothetical protein